MAFSIALKSSECHWAVQNLTDETPRLFRLGLRVIQGKILITQSVSLGRDIDLFVAREINILP